MTFNGWVQIVLFSLVVIAVTRPMGGYLHRVFDGGRTILHPVLRPVERAIYWCSGVDETKEQGWLTYAVSMLFFSVAGFVSLYALQRLQAVLPFNPAGQSNVEQSLAFNTSISFVTNTNWQSYVPETTMSYLTQMAGLTVHNFVSAATGMEFSTYIANPLDQRRFDMHVDIFEFRFPHHLTACDLTANGVERLDDLLAFFSSEQTHLGKHSCMSLRTANIDNRKSTVE